jgi:hypothetical protein
VGVQRGSLVTTLEEWRRVKSWPDPGKAAGHRLKRKRADAMMTVLGARMVERKVKKEKEKEEELNVEVEYNN